MLFRILKIYSLSKQGITDPESVLADEISGFLIGTILIPVFAAIGFLIFLGALAFSHFWGGPYLIAKFFFFFLLIPYFAFGTMLFYVLRFIRQASKSVVRQGKEILEVTVEEVPEE